MSCKKWWETESPQSKHLINTWKSMVRELKELQDDFRKMEKLVTCMENCYRTNGKLKDLLICINACYDEYKKDSK